MTAADFSAVNRGSLAEIFNRNQIGNQGSMQSLRLYMKEKHIEGLIKEKEIHMEDSSVLKLTGIITDFSLWDDTIHLSALKFHNQYNVYPNILLANDSTYRKIDLYAQKHPNRIVTADNDGNIETIETSDEPYNGLNYFTTEDYKLECCMDFDLQEGYFTLIFDEAPDFDGEPVEKPEEQENVYTYRKSA